jgi:LysR family glycine cleavage system transcriptional activator
MNRLPPLNALKSFEAAARRGSFQAAAEELFVTPSAISHQLKALEDFLGLELFIRQPRKVTLTQAGDDYYHSIQGALMEIDQSTQRLISTHQSGVLHLSMAPAFLSRWLLPRISSFYEAQPDVKLELSSSAGLVDFDRSETDMAVYFGNGDWPDIEMHLLRHYHQTPVCSPKLLEKCGVNNPEDILQYTLLHVTKRQDDWLNWFQKAGVNYKELKQGMNLSSGALTAVAAINGLGVALADLGFVNEELSSGKLIAPLDIAFGNSKSFYLVYQKKRAMTYAMKAFQLWLMEEMSKDVMSSNFIH